MFFTGVILRHVKEMERGCQLVPTLNGQKKASNKNCSTLNFVQKSPQTCMSISSPPPLGGGAIMTLERLIWLLYYMILKLQITFNLGLLPKIRNTSKNLQMKVVQN